MLAFSAAAQFMSAPGQSYSVSQFNKPMQESLVRLAAYVCENGMIGGNSYGAAREMLMRAELERIASLPKLSRDVFEVVSKSLQDS